MGKVGHRTETLRIGFQPIESVTDLVNDLIERGKREIRACVFRALLPTHVRPDSAQDCRQAEQSVAYWSES